MPKGVLQVELPGMSWFGLNYQRLTLQPDEGLTVIGYCIYLFLPANTRPSPTSFVYFPSCAVWALNYTWLLWINLWSTYTVWSQLYTSPFIHNSIWFWSWWANFQVEWCARRFFCPKLRTLKCKMEINKTGFMDLIRIIVFFVFYSIYGLVDIQVADLRL